jgi:hypothetical protein
MSKKHDPAVEQALAEIENAERLGSPDAIQAAEKRLAAAGHKRAAARKRAATTVTEPEEPDELEPDTEPKSEAEDDEPTPDAAPRGRTASPRKATTHQEFGS